VWKERNKRDRIRVSEIAIKRLVRTYQRMGQRRRCRSSAVTGHHRRTRTRTRTNCSQSHYSSASMERSCACAPLCVCVCVCYMHVTGWRPCLAYTRSSGGVSTSTDAQLARAAALLLSHYSIVSDGIPLHYVFMGRVGRKSEYHGGRRVTKYVGMYIPKYDSPSNYIYELIQI